MSNHAAIKKLMERFPMKETATGNIRTCPVRLSYPHLFVPHVSKKFAGTNKPRYEVDILFPRGANISLLEEACAHTAIEAFGPKWKSLKVVLPFKDQGEFSSAGYEKGAWMIKPSAPNSTPVPVVLSDAKTPAKPADIYSGVWALVSLRPYSNDWGTKRISLNIESVMKLCDGERLGGRVVKPENEFEPADMDDAVMADAENDF
jgi:hypothetical protein